MTESDVIKLKWYQELLAEVQAAFDSVSVQHEALVPTLESEQTGLEKNVKGWSQTLANPNLQSVVRAHVEAQLNTAFERIAEIELALSVKTTELRQKKTLVDPAAIAERLNDLTNVLASHNPSWGGIELAHHIDRIDCFDDGQVVVRTCRLGALDCAVDVLSDVEATGGQSRTRSAHRQPGRADPRRLTRRKIETGEAPKAELRARATWASDPHRFAGLDDRWFVERAFQVPERLSWAAQHSGEVGQLRKQNYTEEMLAAHFDKTLPTIRASLRIAKEKDPELAKLPRRMPRPRWHEVNARDVALKEAAGMSVLELAEHFGFSDTTIRSALNYAKTLGENDASPEPSRG